MIEAKGLKQLERIRAKLETHRRRSGLAANTKSAEEFRAGGKGQGRSNALVGQEMNGRTKGKGNPTSSTECWKERSSGRIGRWRRIYLPAVLPAGPTRRRRRQALNQGSRAAPRPTVLQALGGSGRRTRRHKIDGRDDLGLLVLDQVAWARRWPRLVSRRSLAVRSFGGNGCRCRNSASSIKRLGVGRPQCGGGVSLKIFTDLACRRAPRIAGLWCAAVSVGNTGSADCGPRIGGDIDAC